jgi:hypothetical protein
MSFFTVTKVKACRKPCRCYWCAGRINVGEPKTTTSTVYDGDFQFTLFHPECYDALEKWHSENPNEWEWPDHGEMKRGSTEQS